jgi:hypothetical protein
MRHVALLLLSLVLFAACDQPKGKIAPVIVQWMDWPAEVNAGQSFRTRLVVQGVCASNPRFHAGASADESAVTFAPYFEVDNDVIYCLTPVVTSLAVIGIDTAGMAPGLSAPFARTYEMRASATTNPSPAVLAALPVRTFGNVVVRPTAADPSRRNAAGVVFMDTDSLGCVRLRPFGAYQPDAALVLENQSDTVGLSYAFVRGYIYDAAAPVCGETRVFHLVTRN